MRGCVPTELAIDAGRAGQTPEADSVDSFAGNIALGPGGRAVVVRTHWRRRSRVQRIKV
jgi:hypothetical protein